MQPCATTPITPASDHDGNRIPSVSRNQGEKGQNSSCHAYKSLHAPLPCRLLAHQNTVNQEAVQTSTPGRHTSIQKLICFRSLLPKLRQGHSLPILMSFDMKTARPSLSFMGQMLIMVGSCSLPRELLLCLPPPPAMTHTNPGPSSFFNPPLHIHVSQTEDFVVVSGEGTWHMPNHPDPTKRRIILSSKASNIEDRKAHIPVGYYHRFENLDPNIPLVLKVRLDEEEYAAEETFFRNFFGYLDDCRKADVQPSPFQIFVFLYWFGAPLGLPVPGPMWLKNGVSRAFTTIMGPVIGTLLLGYQNSYPEYYNPKMSQ